MLSRLPLFSSSLAAILIMAFCSSHSFGAPLPLRGTIPVTFTIPDVVLVSYPNCGGVSVPELVPDSNVGVSDGKCHLTGAGAVSLAQTLLIEHDTHLVCDNPGAWLAPDSASPPKALVTNPDDPTKSNSPTIAVILENASGASIENCSIGLNGADQPFDIGIMIVGGSNNVIGLGPNAVTVNYVGALLVGTEGNRIIGNAIDFYSDQGIGIGLIRQCHNNSITGNEVTGLIAKNFLTPRRLISGRPISARAAA